MDIHSTDPRSVSPQRLSSSQQTAPVTCGRRLARVEYALNVAPTPRTGRLLLRAWEERDVPAMLEAYRDPLMRHWLWTKITTAAEARRLVEARRAAHEAGDRLSFAILEAAGPETAGPETTGQGAVRELVGGINLRGLADGSGMAEVGYWVTAAARGRGIAPVAVNALCEWASACR